MQTLPGSPRHQALLRAIADHYAADARVLLVGLFGSVARGNWHKDSDLDLDVVLADGVAADPVAEAWQLSGSLAAIGERIALVVPDGPDAADAVLASLARFSVRYHALETTSPNIVASLMPISSRGDIEPVLAAGRANRPRQPAAEPPERVIDRCVRYALETTLAVERGQLWLGQELLGRVRGLLMAIFAQANGEARPIQYFDAHAPAALQAMLGEMIAVPSAEDMRRAVRRALDVLDQNLGDFAGGGVRLSEAQQGVVAATKAKVAGYGSPADW